MLPIEKIGDILVIVSPGVGEEEALASVRKATGCSVFPFQCDAEDFEKVLEGYYERLGASRSLGFRLMRGDLGLSAGVT